MYTSLHIQNFRGFRDLTVGPLQRVNLFVAKNNVGKTALLEAVALLADGKGIVQSFPMTFRNCNDSEQKSEFWVWLFHGTDSSSTISISASCAGAALNCTGDTLKQSIKLQYGDAPRPVGPGTDSQKFQHVLSFPVEGINRPLMMRTDPEITRNGQLRDLNETNGGAKIFATNPMNPVEEARKFHKVMLKKDGEEKVQALLKIIEPRLIKIRPAQTGKQPSIYADIGLSGLIPVSQLGQGFSRILSIYTAILLSEAKVFLIDEVENGIHYSALEQVWKGLAEVAERENVQVFATTHSWECIVAAEKVFAKREPYDFALHRLQIGANGVEAKTYDHDTLATSIREGFEIR